MTLNQVTWKIFDVDPKAQIKAFAQDIKDKASQADSEAPAASIDAAPYRKRRLNTKLRQQSTMQDLGTSEQTHINTFWERNFTTDEEVPWYKFQTKFLEDYESKLSGEEHWAQSLV